MPFHICCAHVMSRIVVFCVIQVAFLRIAILHSCDYLRFLANCDIAFLRLVANCVIAFLKPEPRPTNCRDSMEPKCGAKLSRCILSYTSKLPWDAVLGNSWPSCSTMFMLPSLCISATGQLSVPCECTHFLFLLDHFFFSPGSTRRPRARPNYLTP